MKRAKWEVPMKTGDEYDYLTPRDRCVHLHKPGQVPAIKRKYRKRVRVFEKTLISEAIRELADDNC